LLLPTVFSSFFAPCTPTVGAVDPALLSGWPRGVYSVQRGLLPDMGYVLWLHRGLSHNVFSRRTQCTMLVTAHSGVTHCTIVSAFAAPAWPAQLT
jgi:hypothetical protein